MEVRISYFIKGVNNTSSISHKLDCVVESKLVRQVQKISEIMYLRCVRITHILDGSVCKNQILRMQVKSA